MFIIFRVFILAGTFRTKVVQMQIVLCMLSMFLPVYYYIK